MPIFGTDNPEIARQNDIQEKARKAEELKQQKEKAERELQARIAEEERHQQEKKRELEKAEQELQRKKTEADLKSTGWF